MNGLTRTDYITCLAELASVGIAILAATWTVSAIPIDALVFKALTFFGVFVCTARVILPFANRGYNPDGGTE